MMGGCLHSSCASAGTLGTTELRLAESYGYMAHVGRFRPLSCGDWLGFGVMMPRAARSWAESLSEVKSRPCDATIRPIPGADKAPRDSR